MTLVSMPIGGAKIHLHISLYEKEMAILDGICAHYDCSRATAIGALLKDYGAELRPNVVFEPEPGRRAKRETE